jgi:hypothetical protein
MPNAERHALVTGEAIGIGGCAALCDQQEMADGFP